VTRKLEEVVRVLFPGYFAYVMATGIVAAALAAFGFLPEAKALFALGVAGYVVLWVLTIFRSVRFPRQLLADFTSFTKGPGFFTIIAGTDVLGALSIRLFHATDLAFALLCLGGTIWVVFNYSFATVVIVSAEKPTAERSVSGTWLVIVVATQSLAVLSALLSDRIPLFVAAGFFMIGAATYLMLIALIVSRLVLTKVEAADLAPPYWIMMGGAAISCLAGVSVDQHSGAWGFDVNAFPVLQAFTVFFWMVATAWIPLLVILGVWRHGFKHVPLRYEPQLWSMVFPLGMYTFATYSMSIQFKLPFLEPIAAFFLPIACLAWLWSFGGMARGIVRGLMAGDPMIQDLPQSTGPAPVEP